MTTALCRVMKRLSLYPYQGGYSQKLPNGSPYCAEAIFLPGEPTGTIKFEFQGAYFALEPLSDATAISHK